MKTPKLLLALGLVLAFSQVFSQTSSTGGLDGKTFSIQSAMNYDRNNGGYWDIPGDPTHIQKGSNIQVWNLNNGVDRKYTLIRSSQSGFYEIFVGNTRNSRVDIAGGNSKNGTNVGVWESNGGNNQRFRFQHLGNGRFKIFDSNGKVICLDGRKNANGTNVHIWDDHDGPWVEWYLISEQTGEAFIPSTKKTLVPQVGSSSIKTNYFDLPRGKEYELKSKLKTDRIEQLPSESVNMLSEYLSNKVLRGSNPYAIEMRSNYFWNIFNALPSFVPAKDRHTGYNQGQREYTTSEQLMAYAIYRINRSPENIQRIFTLVKPNLVNLVSPDVYKNSGVETYVKEAIDTYKSITQIPNYSRLLQRAYSQIDTTTGSMVWEGNREYFQKSENSAYGFSVYELNQIISKHLRLDSESSLSYSSWLSFWMRRNHEGNINEVYNILNEIQSIYYPNNTNTKTNTKTGNKTDPNKVRQGLKR